MLHDNAINHLIEVEWIDSSGTSEWLFHKEVFSIPPNKISSIGYLLEETEDYLVLVQSIGSDKDNLQYQGTMTIPKGCISGRRVFIR